MIAEQGTVNIRNLILKQLLFELNEQYENNSFEVNQCLRHSTESILTRAEKFKVKISEAEVNAIRSQVTLFLYAFIKAPSMWADMLTNDQISSSTTVITINTTQTLTKIYRQIIKETNALVKQNRADVASKTDENGKKLEIVTFNFEIEYLSEGTKTLMAELLNNLAIQICKFYSRGKQIIIDEEKTVQDKMKNSQIMNPYLLFGILKQMSTYTYEKVQQQMSIFFKNLPADTIHKFCRYVQKSYEFVQLKTEQKIAHIYTEQEMVEHIDKVNQFWLNYLSAFQDGELTLKKVQSAKGDTAVMLIPNKKKLKDQSQNQQSFNDAQKIILKVGTDNKIHVTNSRASQKKWEIFNMKDSVSGFYKILKNEIAEQSGKKIQKEVIAYGVPLGQYANLGGNVGRCLADINKYKSANQFFMDLSKSTVIGGSLTYILTQVPILSYFVIAGGLTYTFYHTFNNRATSRFKKAKQVGKTTITAVGSVGSAVAGMMLGQTLIPIPFLGAFVGGVIGGFLGQTGSNIMTKLMDKESFRNLIKQLKDTIVDNKYWIFTHYLLEKLGVNKKYFNKQLCHDQKQQDAYITAICYCVVSSYESKRYTQRNEKKLKELQLKKSKSKNKQKSEEIQQNQPKHQQEQELDDIKQAKLLNQQQSFDNQFNIVGIVDYLTSQNIAIIKQHDKLQNCIRHIHIS